MPLGAWDFALPHFCTASNFADVDGESAWKKRHKKGSFKGIQRPFGSRVDFLPPKSLKQRLPVFSPSAVPGVFMGWHMHPGGHWSKDYLVSYLPDFEAVQSGKTKKIHVYRVRDIHVNEGPVEFALKKAADELKGTVTKGRRGREG